MGGKTSTTTQKVEIPPEVLARYNAVNARAENVAKKPFQMYGTQASDFVAQLNNQQLSGMKNVNAAAGSYQPYISAATDATKAGMASAQPGQLNIDQYMNPFQQQVIDATMARMAQEQEQQQSGALGTAISSGAFGGDRAGIAAANLAQQQGMATGATLAGLNAQNYQQALATAQQQQGLQLSAEQADLARLLSGGQQLAGLGQANQAMGLQGAEAQINAGTLAQQTEQAGISALYNQFQQMQAYPFQVAQFLANIAMGTGALSGSTTTTTQPAPWWSDRRLKHDIKRIGKSDNGLPIYTFKYKGDPEKQTHVGFMADEVEKRHPEAVGLAPNGYKYVDYDRAAKADGGGVAGPYGAIVGSQPGAGSYVPQAYLPVGELMIADGSVMSNSQRSMAEQLAAMARLGESAKSIKDTWDWAKDNWGSKDREDALASAEEARGVAPFASGGAAYLETSGLGGANLNPVSKDTYLSDTVKGQEEGKKNQLMQPGSPPPQGESPASGIGNLLSGVAQILPFLPFLSTGGVVPKGYADGGAPESEEEIARRRLLASDVPMPRTLGDLPDATVRPVAETAPSGEGDLGSDMGAAIRSLGRDAVGYTAGDVDPGLARGVGMLPAGLTAKADAKYSLPRVETFPTPPREAMPNADLTGLAAAAIDRADVKPAMVPSAPATGVAPAATATAKGPLADTGTVVPGGYEPIVTPKAQLDFMTYELSKPEYRAFNEGKYATPAEAAVAFEQIYERAGGEGNDRAKAYATDVYNAATNGDLSSLPPNAAMAYQHFISNGMDPIKAAGATGRLMVESYAHMDPNARLIDGSGNGAYGFAQWRGDRLKELAEFAGVPLEAIISAPASTPEGRYYSTGLSGARVGEASTSGAGLAGNQSILTSDKPYGDRTTIGKMFYNPDGTVNRNALLSLASGIGSMLSSPSQFLLPSIGMGLQGAASTYAGLEQMNADVTGKNIENMSKIVEMYNDFIYANPKYESMSLDEFVKAQGLERFLPEGGIDYNPTSGSFDVTAGNRRDGISLADRKGMVPVGNGIMVPVMNDYASLMEIANNYGSQREGSRARALADQAKAKLAEIEANGGYTTGFGPDGQPVLVPVDAVREKLGNAATDTANIEMTQNFRNTAQESLAAVDDGINRIDRQIDLYKSIPSGAFTKEKADLGAIARAVGLEGIGGLPNSELTGKIQEAIKDKALGILNRGGSQGMTDYERQFVEQSAASPNLEPNAIKKLLAIEKATLLRDRELLAGHTEWMTTASNPYDLNAYKKQFLDQNPLSDYIKRVEAEMPQFAGEALDANSVAAEMMRRGYIQGADGKWRKP